MKKKILILCTGNSCRSQMAEGFLRNIQPQWEVHSAGTKPTSRVHPLAIQVMLEKKIDISASAPKDVSEFLEQEFDAVITVCDSAKDACPVFAGMVHKNVHIGFDDPAEANGSEKEILNVFRRVRDEIENRFTGFAAEM